MNSALIFVLFYGLVPLGTAVFAYFMIRRSYTEDDEQ